MVEYDLKAIKEGEKSLLSGDESDVYDIEDIAQVFTPVLIREPLAVLKCGLIVRQKDLFKFSDPDKDLMSDVDQAMSLGHHFRNEKWRTDSEWCEGKNSRIAPFLFFSDSKSSLVDIALEESLAIASQDEITLEFNKDNPDFDLERHKKLWCDDKFPNSGHKRISKVDFKLIYLNHGAPVSSDEDQERREAQYEFLNEAVDENGETLLTPNFILDILPDEDEMVKSCAVAHGIFSKLREAKCINLGLGWHIKAIFQAGFTDSGNICGIMYVHDSMG